MNIHFDDMHIVCILGAMDPEMQTIKTLLEKLEDCVIFPAKSTDGRLVYAGNAYQADFDRTIGNYNLKLNEITILIECNFNNISLAHSIHIDHHWPGDFGYCRPPAEFWSASSIGQLCKLIGVEPTPELQLVAAADHCLAAAYAGQCPGIDPAKLMEWRVASRAAFQNRTIEEVIADVQTAKKLIEETIAKNKFVYLTPCTGGMDDFEHSTNCGCPLWGTGYHPVLDLRGAIIPELPEAAALLGQPILAGPLACPDGRQKFVLQSAGRELIIAWLTNNEPPEIVNRYGDPERGFAGGYLK
ncbi:MAG: hypothetical protein PHD05_00680 [Sphaerochaetaceae bacterium]|nr:hypothetical protein [Sphaerochaetaceae bacterium]